MSGVKCQVSHVTKWFIHCCTLFGQNTLLVFMIWNLDIWNPYFSAVLKPSSSPVQSPNHPDFVWYIFVYVLKLKLNVFLWTKNVNIDYLPLSPIFVHILCQPPRVGGGSQPISDFSDKAGWGVCPFLIFFLIRGGRGVSQFQFFFWQGVPKFK